MAVAIQDAGLPAQAFALKQAGVPVAAPLHPICIEQELESWLLASDHANEELLPTLGVCAGPPVSPGLSKSCSDVGDGP